MRKIAVYFLLALISLNTLGCAPLIVGAAVGALGGYAASKDSIQGETDKPYESLWGSALAVSRIRGTIKQEDASGGYIELNVESSRVWVKLIRLTYATTRLKVSARKYHLPNMALAQDMFVKITEGAK